LGRLTVPPDTTVAVQGPRNSPTAGNIASIEFRNHFVDLKLSTTQSGGGVGLGAYSMFDARDAFALQNLYWHVDFVLRMEATFSWILAGNPAMKAHREWATGILDLLTREFDDQSLWRRASDAYMLQQHLPAKLRSEDSEPEPVLVALPPDVQNDSASPETEPTDKPAQP
jgi:hypothetical protein